MNNRPKTIFCDIDGVLLIHTGHGAEQHLQSLKLLDGVLEKLKEWDTLGYKIILTTGRRESTRSATESQLLKAGIIYDQLIMGITSGTRVIINDLKPNNDIPTALAINLPRNKGLSEVNI